MRSIHVATAVALLLAASSVQALQPPQGRVLLTISGAITETNADGEAHFDLEMLQALPQHETITATPWHDHVVSFTGPLGRELLAAVGAEGQQLRVTALNDYSAIVPVDDLQGYDVIFATHMDGERLRVRDHGPLFIIYPFDQHPHLLNEEILTRSVWQIHHIEVLQD